MKIFLKLIFLLVEASYFIKYAFTELKDEFKRNLHIQIENNNSMLMSLLVAILIIIVLGFTVFFLPWVKVLRDEVLRILNFFSLSLMKKKNFYI